MSTTTAPDETDIRFQRRDRAFRRVFTVLLFAFLAAGLAGLLGVTSRDVSATGGGYELSVHYGRITRPGLATPWLVEVRTTDGEPIQEPIRLATTASFFDLFDENGLDPDPTAAFSDDERIIWEFDPPDPESDRMTINYDARIEPGVQAVGHESRTALLDDDGEEIVAVTYETTVLP